jgi:predicted kinase
MMAANDVVKERLNEILTDKSIVKLCFGLDVGEANRIGSDIYNVIDLQEIFMDNITTLSSNNTPSLSTLSTVILNKRLGKTKEIQAGNWSKRPLSSDQMEYAANDVTVLFDMYEYLKKFGVPSKNIYVPKISASRQAKSDFDPNLPVKVLYSAVFLSDTSKKELIKNIKPAHKNVLGDHVTLKYAPSEYYLRGTPVGDVVQIKITGEYTDDFVQAVRVECLNKEYHITLSVTPGTPPKISNDIGRWNDVPEFQLFGIVGVQICDVVDLLATLPDKIKRKILEFKNNAIMDESLKFKPGELSAAERSAIHEYASNNNITSTSTGKNDKRQLILTMRRKLKYDVEDDDKDGEHLKRITDMYQFSAMKIVNENDEILTKGYILDDDIKLSNEDLLLSEKILVILRGLPGSGKSKLAEILNHKFGGCVCSADKFFAMHNEYVFDKSKLDEAHNYCFTKVKSRMESSKHMIIVDNVNSRQNEYAKYISLAHIYNYKIVILEIYCKDRNEAVKFSLRSMHSVPTKDILKMIARWETDDNAVILSPYDFHKDTSETEILQKTYGNKESLHKWLSDMKMYHYNKLRRKTHICMEINSRPIVFLDVPEHLFSEFLERYVASGITDCIDDEPKYIMEVIGTKFKFFLDVDYIDDKKLSTDEIYTLVQKVQMVIKTEIFVTGNISDDYNCKIKTGMHFKFPSLIVDAKEAIELRDKIVSYLKMEMPDKNWDSIIDNTVYMGCRGLRMFGSRKTTKGVDKGKVYKLMLIVNEDGKIVEQTLSELDLLKKLCIVCK